MVTKNARSELDADTEYRIVSTERNLVSNYFYDLLQRKQVYGSKVTVHNNRVTRFLIHERFIIEENENYHDAICTIETLNDGISKDKDKYTYTGQPLHSLAYEYYMNNYDNRIESSMSPQLFEIFESALSRIQHSLNSMTNALTLLLVNI